MLILKENITYRMVYGIDHIEGNFIKITRKKEMDTVFNESGISRDRLIEAAEKFGFNMEQEKDNGDGFGISKSFEGSGCGGGCEYCQRNGI